jgi:hypothetical protein
MNTAARVTAGVGLFGGLVGAFSWGLIAAYRRGRDEFGQQLPLPGVPIPPELPRGPIVQVGVTKPQKGRRKVHGFKLRLTRKQFAKLFPGLERLPRSVWPKAKCGLWGCAYPRGAAGTPEGQEVIKLTNDPNEAAAAQLVKESPVDGALPVLDVFRLKRRGPDLRPVWVLRSRLLPKAPQKSLARALGRCGQSYNYMLQTGAPGYLRLLTCVDRTARFNFGIKPSPDEVQNYVDEFVDTSSNLQALGILWTDLHPGNITEVHGRPTILDIGPYDVDNQDRALAAIPQLARPG